MRLMDESYGKENKIIQEIQDKMVDYFKKRPGKLAQEGIAGEFPLAPAYSFQIRLQSSKSL